MKIVHTEASLGFGGQELRILNEALGMRQRGHELTVICPGQAELYRIAENAGLTTVALPIGKKKWAGFAALRSWLGRYRPDIVNTHSSTDSWLTAIAVRTLAHPPAVVRTRHVSVPISRNLFSRWLYTRGCRHIVTTGEKLRGTLIAENGFAPGRITSVRTGIDLGRFKPGDRAAARRRLNLSADDLIVGIVATLRRWKGHQYLLEAVAGLTEFANLRLVIVGDGPQWQSLRQQAAGLNLQNRVLFAGRQSNIETWLQAFDVFCLPSYANEGVPQSLMQAQACGLAAVTTPVGSIEEAVVPGASALLVPPANAEALRAALAGLLGDPARRADMGLTAADFAREHFSDVRMLDSMEAIFQTACHRQHESS